MFVPYCTYFDGIEVVYSEWRNDFTLVHFEQPDAKYGFKTVDITIPYYRVSNIIGFDEAKISELVTFCKCNAHLIIEGAKEVKGVKR